MRLEGIGPSRTNRDGTMSTIDQNILLEQQRSRPNPRASSLVCSSCYRYTSIIRVHIFQTSMHDHPRHSSAIPQKSIPAEKTWKNFSNKMVEPWYFYPWYGAIFSGSQTHDMNHGWTKPMGRHGSHRPSPLSSRHGGDPHMFHFVPGMCGSHWAMSIFWKPGEITSRSMWKSSKFQLGWLSLRLGFRLQLSNVRPTLFDNFGEVELFAWKKSCSKPMVTI